MKGLSIFFDGKKIRMHPNTYTDHGFSRALEPFKILEPKLSDETLLKDIQDLLKKSTSSVPFKMVTKEEAQAYLKAFGVRSNPQMGIGVHLTSKDDQYTVTPIDKRGQINQLTGLKKLVIGGGKSRWDIKDIFGLVAMTQLQTLSLRSNRISDIRFLKANIPQSSEIIQEWLEASKQLKLAADSKAKLKWTIPFLFFNIEKEFSWNGRDWFKAIREDVKQGLKGNWKEMFVEEG